MSKGKQGVKSAKKDSARRFGAQDRQEAVSKGQFCARLGQLGWNVLQPEKDLGEDYLVQIYDDGVSSGLSFYVQLKSFANAEKRKRKRSPGELRYPLFVKDIEHWEVQSTPVVLVVWDVEKQTGYWETIPRIIEALEKKGKAWREKKSVDVTVSLENGTDDEGMGRLRWLLADDVLGGIRGVRDLSFDVEFSSPEQRLGVWNAFNKALDSGESIALDQSNTAKLQAPKLLRRRYGNAFQLASVTITPEPNKLSIPVRVEVRSRMSNAALPYVDLRVVTQGRKIIRLTNEHQKLPIVISIVLDVDEGMKLSCRRIGLGHTVQQARETVAFFFVLQQQGSYLRVFSEADGQVLFDFPTNRQHFSGIDELHHALEQLAFIDRYLSKYGRLDLDRIVEPDAIAKIAVLHDVIKHGRAKTRCSFDYSIESTAEDIDGGDCPDIVEHLSGSKMTLLGVEIPLGRVRREIRDARLVAAMRDGIGRARATGTAVTIHVEDVETTDIFLDWPPPRDRLQDLAATQSGYFTITQALEAGFTSAGQLQIHERVEPCAEGVYRFILHPPSEHEDLVVTWLQTEKQGVFSHDTALALHELSDILPVRQHVTVPQGWKPIEGMALSPNTVVHYGLITDEEKSWMGPVPYTKPLRTLVDCIDDTLPPDIVDQALSDAHRRGMLSQVELHNLQIRKAKSA